MATDSELKPYDTHVDTRPHFHQDYSTGTVAGKVCAVCSRPIEGTQIHYSGKSHHVGCVSIQTLQSMRAMNMRPLTASERAKLGGVKPAPSAPDRGKAPAGWVKALGKAVESPRFRLEGMPLDKCSTDTQRAVALAAEKAVTLRGAVTVDEVRPVSVPSAPKWARKPKPRTVPKPVAPIATEADPTPTVPTVVHRGGLWTCRRCSSTFYVPEGSPESFADFGVDHGRTCVTPADIRDALFRGQRVAAHAA